MSPDLQVEFWYWMTKSSDSHRIVILNMDTKFEPLRSAS